MKVAVAFDHRGVKLREAVLEAVAQAGCDAIDLGVEDSSVRVDYPDQAWDVASRSAPLGRSVEYSSAAREWAPAWLPASCRAFAPRSATTPTRPTRVSSTTI